MKIEEQTVNELRVLSNEMITHAGSGHPGIALSAMPIVYTLYAKHLRYSTKEDKHFLRDRFVLSAGHGSAMLYAVLHAMGFAITKADLENFRSLNAITSGHPEIQCPGVDDNTGPLGQGVANAVGMAIAEKRAEALYNTENCTLFDQKIYCLVGDGCLMEGIAYEALTLAGTLQLNNLIVLYDCNQITIDSRISQTFPVDIKAMMESIGFEVFTVKDGNDLDEIDRAIQKAKQTNKPSFVLCHTIIGYGSLYQDNCRIHGTPLKPEELQKLCENFGIKKEPFSLSSEVKIYLETVKEESKKRFAPLKEKLATYKKTEKAKYEKLQQSLLGHLEGIEKVIDAIPYQEGIASRDMSGMVLGVIGKLYNTIVCGSADLKNSTKCEITSQKAITKEDFSGQNILFGLREHAMAGIANGMALFDHTPMAISTFLSFVDYMKAAMRMSCMMNLPILYILTHDSILVGEDGPTHQPVEQLTGLRATPNLDVWRPCNFEEVKACYQSFFMKKSPTCLIGTRQKLPVVDADTSQACKGAYIISSEGKGSLEGIILASGSEVSLAIKAQIDLMKKGYNIRVVSVPCLEVFLSQPESYQKKILPPRVQSLLAVEASEGSSWYQVVGTLGDVLSIHQYGKSGKAEQVYKDYGFTVEEVEKKMIKLIKKNHSKIYTIFE